MARKKMPTTHIHGVFYTYFIQTITDHLNDPTRLPKRKTELDVWSSNFQFGVSWSEKKCHLKKGENIVRLITFERENSRTTKVLPATGWEVSKSVSQAARLPLTGKPSYV